MQMSLFKFMLPLILIYFHKQLLDSKLESKNVVSFIKTRFYWKKGCITMRNYAETF